MATTSQNGLYGKMMEIFKASPTKLFTHDDFVELLDIDQQAAQNGVFYLYRDAKVMRHIDKCPETRLFRHAIRINENKAAPYVKGTPNKGDTVGARSRRKGQLPSSREIRTAFAQTMNQLAKLEDMVADVVDLAEDTEKKMKKIENLLR